MSSWCVRVERALRQRIFLMTAQQVSESHYAFELMGTSGRAYTLSLIANEPVTCSCPDCSQTGHFCKHLIFLLMRVLHVPTNAYEQGTQRMPPNSTMQACKALLLCPVWKSPLSPIVCERKEYTEDDCPVCCESFADTAYEATVWCKISCGRSIHKECWIQWMRVGKASSCVMCRADWT
jgi:hypothetical protein